jgi:hypothetical protein
MSNLSHDEWREALRRRARVSARTAPTRWSS